MKFKTTILITMYISFLLNFSYGQNIELPLTFHNGYGHFSSGFGGIPPYSEDENNPWKKTYLKVTGVPVKWADVKLGDIETNIYQTVYQNYLLGNITNERYEELQKSWTWIPDTLNLSKKALKCKIAYACGKDSTGLVKMVVDANNNLDFSDDKIFTPVEIAPNGNINNDSLAHTNSINVFFESYINSKIVLTNTPLLIVYMKSINMFMCNFPQYAKTKFDDQEIAICSDLFTSLTYNNPSIVLINDSLKVGEKANYEKRVLKNEYIDIKGKTYKLIGVNLKNNTLILEKMKLPKNALYSTQIGYKSFPFEGVDFKTNFLFSLDSLKGKYVLLDFWSVYCGPCRKEIPNIKEFYDKIDKSKFEIISIVCDSPSETLSELINIHSITWPQIMSNDLNKIKEKYSIQGYPTTLLLNPEGIIIAKDLRGVLLEDKVKSLIKE